jgi:hypothetical protein
MDAENSLDTERHRYVKSCLSNPESRSEHRKICKNFTNKKLQYLRIKQVKTRRIMINIM